VQRAEALGDSRFGQRAGARVHRVLQQLRLSRPVESGERALALAEAGSAGVRR